jgi:hypothetical protein
MAISPPVCISAHADYRYLGLNNPVYKVITGVQPGNDMLSYGLKEPAKISAGLVWVDFAVLKAVPQAHLGDQRYIELQLSMLFDSLQARKRPKPT